MLNDCRKKLVPVIRGEGGRWVHDRHNLHFLAVTEEISPGLHPVPGPLFRRHPPRILLTPLHHLMVRPPGGQVVLFSASPSVVFTDCFLQCPASGLAADVHHEFAFEVWVFQPVAYLPGRNGAFAEALAGHQGADLLVDLAAFEVEDGL